jgi:hypothetical protein
MNMERWSLLETAEDLYFMQHDLYFAAIIAVTNNPKINYTRGRQTSLGADWSWYFGTLNKSAQNRRIAFFSYQGVFLHKCFHTL